MTNDGMTNQGQMTNGRMQREACLPGRIRHLAFVIHSSFVILSFVIGWATGSARAAEGPKELVPKASCTSASCHADFAKRRYVHGPVAAKECAVCHVWKDNKHAFTLVSKGTKLCTECHDDVLIEKKGDRKLTLHKPVKEDCTTCHDPHGSDIQGILSMAVVPMCGTCHDKTVAAAKDKAAISHHSSVLQGKACLNCHVAHTSLVPKLLATGPMATCLGCHDKVQKAGSQTVANIKEEITTKKYVHGPIQDKDCTSCHAVHGSRVFDLLTGEYPEKFYAPFTPKTYELCLGCHEKGLVLDKETKGLTGFRNGTANLHYLHVNRSVKGRSCRACHGIHAADQPVLVRASVPFGPSHWALPIVFTKTSTGGSCASGCHEYRSYDREKPISYELPPEAASTPQSPKEPAKAKEPEKPPAPEKGKPP